MVILMHWRKTFVFMLFLLTGIALGTLLSELTSQFAFLNWLNIGQSVGIGFPEPLTLDLSVIKVAFGFSININIIKMISIIFCLWMYKRFAKGL